MKAWLSNFDPGILIGGLMIMTGLVSSRYPEPDPLRVPSADQAVLLPRVDLVSARRTETLPGRCRAEGDAVGDG